MFNRLENRPLETLHLFPILDKLLIELLSSLTEEEWHSPTIARHWSVKDIAAHLLDGNLRGLSGSRDRFFDKKPDHMHTYQDLVAYLNQLNHEWVKAAKRMSPELIIDLLEKTGDLYTEHLKTLEPLADAIFPVAWAGQTISPNWFHIAR